MKKLLLVLNLAPLLVLGQYAMDFSTVNKGVAAINTACTQGGGALTLCDGYDVSGVNWTISDIAGDPWNFNPGEYVKVLTAGSFETRDPDGPICINSPEINIMGLGTVTITVSVEEEGSLETADVVVFTYTVDGTPTVLSVNENFNSQTWTPMVSGNTLSISVCLDNNATDEIQRITEVSTDKGVALPIRLASFKAQLNDAEQVELYWTTAQELNNDYMAIERSNDGRAFLEIGRVQGIGDSNEMQTYFFMDKTPEQGVNYYRLRQVDYDGTTAYHRVVAITVHDEKPLVEILTNPIGQNSDLILRTPLEEASSFKVISLSGLVIHQGTLPANDRNIELPLAFMPSGYYFLNIQTKDWSVTRKFVKQ